MENNGGNVGASVRVEEYNVIGSFTQLATALICDDDILHAGDLF